MRLGMIVRADCRGLAYQTEAIWRMLAPDVTVVVDISPIDPEGRWPQDFGRYPGAIVSPWQGHMNVLHDSAVSALIGCDVIYSAETFYDPRLLALAHAAGTATVLHVNPEMYRGEQPTALWYPSTWRMMDLPPGEHMPVPVGDLVPTRWDPDGPVLHVGGHRASGDRNGTTIAMHAAGLLKGTHWRVSSQDGRLRPGPQLAPRLENPVAVADRWSLYDGASMLVMPRRYGGLCLPVLEAAASGLPIVMPDCPPNDTDYPIVPAPGWRWGGMIQTPAGRIRLVMPDPRGVAAAVGRLLGDRDELAAAAARSTTWAARHTADALRPRYLASLHRVLTTLRESDRLTGDQGGST